jgi:hypothetical protein
VDAAYQGWDGKSYDELAQKASRLGAGGDAVQGIINRGLEIKQKLSGIAKDDALTGKNQIGTLIQKNDLLDGAYSSLLALPDDQLPQAVISTASNWVSRGFSILSTSRSLSSWDNRETLRGFVISWKCSASDFGLIRSS